MNAALSRFLAFFLALSLSLPNSAWALRTLNAGMEESPINEKLRARFGIPDSTQTTDPLTGLEEDLEQIFVTASEDPTYEKTRQDSLSMLLRELNTSNDAKGKPLPSSDIPRLTVRLHNLFFDENVSVGKLWEGAKEPTLFQDFGSGQTISSVSWNEATNGIILVEGDLNKKVAVSMAYRGWQTKHRLGEPLYLLSEEEEHRQKLAATEAARRFKQEITDTYKNIRLVSEEVSPNFIEAAILALKLLPASMLGSDLVARRLQGGIHLAVERDRSTRLGQYVEEKARLGIQPTTFSGRGFIEAFLHEFGHVVQKPHLSLQEFLTLRNAANQDLYALPAMNMSAKDRVAYIAGAPSDFFAETFMHYILHGELMANGFPQRVKNSALWKQIYSYYRDNVFCGVEYRVLGGKLVGIPSAGGLEESSGFIPQIIDGWPHSHNLDAGRQGTQRLRPEQAEFLRQFIQEQILDTGRANPDPTMKEYLQGLVTDKGQPTTRKLEDKFRHDPSFVLGGIGSASTDQKQVDAGEEIISIASDLLGPSQQALETGRFSDDSLELLTEVLLHEANHVLDTRDHRLDAWMEKAPLVAGRMGVPLEQLKIHFSEMSAMGRTTDVIGGSYMPDSNKPLGGAFVYRYRTEPEKAVPLDTQLFRHQPSRDEMEGVRSNPQTTRGISPWAQYTASVSGNLSTGLEEGTPGRNQLETAGRVAVTDQAREYLRDLTQFGATIQVLDPEMLEQYPELAPLMVLTELSDSILIDRGEETLRDLRARGAQWVDYYGLPINAARFDQKADGMTVIPHKPGDESFIQFLTELLHAMAPLRLATQTEVERLADQLLQLAA